MKKEVRKYLSEIGRRGGKKSRRKLDSKSARAMVQVREAKRAFKFFYHQCFWSYQPTLKIGINDVQWVHDELIKNGGREAWKVAAKLCR